VKAWLEILHIKVVEHAGAGMKYTLATAEDIERKAYLPTVTMTSHGVDSFYRFPYEFFISHDYQTMTQLGGALQGLLSDSAYIQRAEKKMNVSSFKEVLAWLMEEAKRGQQIQRYKGLGEMNPDQLWETTMDPNVRRMLSVKIEDAIAADEIFTTLMGDNVENRRDFIETNALLAGNLDI
jgi:DNA gyrase subunit B